MPKLRIVHKGLILVGVPLFFGICFISVIYSGLAKANQMIERELVLKDAAVSHVTSLTCGACSSIWKLKYAATRDPYIKKCYITNKKRAQAADERLKLLLENDPTISIPKTSEKPFRLFNFNGPSGGPHSSLANSPLLHELQRRIDEQTKATNAAVESLRWILYGGQREFTGSGQRIK